MEPGLEFSKSGREKNKPRSTPFGDVCTRAAMLFLANVLSGAVRPGSGLSFWSLLWGLQLVRALGVCGGVSGQENRDPQHWGLGLQRAGRLPLRRPRVPGERWQDPYPGKRAERGPWRPLILQQQGRRPRRRDADTGRPPSRSSDGTARQAHPRREHPGSDMDARAEKARWILPSPQRGCPGSVGTARERAKPASAAAVWRGDLRRRDPQPCSPAAFSLCAWRPTLRLLNKKPPPLPPPSAV